MFPILPLLPLFPMLLNLKIKNAEINVPNITIITNIPGASDFETNGVKAIFPILPKLPLFHHVFLKKGLFQHFCLISSHI